MGEEGIIALMIIVFFIVILLLAMSMAGGEVRTTSYTPPMKPIDAYPPNYIFPNQDVKLKSLSVHSLQLAGMGFDRLARCNT